MYLGENPHEETIRSLLRGTFHGDIPQKKSPRPPQEDARARCDKSAHSSSSSTTSQISAEEASFNLIEARGAPLVGRRPILLIWSARPELGGATPASHDPFGFEHWERRGTFELYHFRSHRWSCAEGSRGQQAIPLFLQRYSKMTRPEQERIIIPPTLQALLEDTPRPSSRVQTNISTGRRWRVSFFVGCGVQALRTPHKAPAFTSRPCSLHTQGAESHPPVRS